MRELNPASVVVNHLFYCPCYDKLNVKALQIALVELGNRCLILDELLLFGL